LEKKIGEGAHSVVYRCLEKKSGNRYAVKVTKIKD
jgi:serine/threonine protein kinase